MKWGALAILLVVLLGVAAGVIRDVAERCPVNEGVECYTYIVEALDAADGEDLVHIYPGSYSINKSREWEKSLNIYGMGNPDDVVLSCVDNYNAFYMLYATINLHNVTITGCNRAFSMHRTSGHLANVKLHDNSYAMSLDSSIIVVDGDLETLDSSADDHDIYLYGSSLTVYGSVYSRRSAGYPLEAEDGSYILITGDFIVEGRGDDTDEMEIYDGSYLEIGGDLNITHTSAACFYVDSGKVLVHNNVYLTHCGSYGIYNAEESSGGAWFEVEGDVTLLDSGSNAVSFETLGTLIVHGDLVIQRPTEYGVYFEQSGYLEVYGTTRISQVNSGNYALYAESEYTVTFIFHGDFYLSDSEATEGGVYSYWGSQLYFGANLYVTNYQSTSQSIISVSNMVVEGDLIMDNLFSSAHILEMNSGTIITWGAVSITNSRGEENGAVISMEEFSWVSVGAVTVGSCMAGSAGLIYASGGSWTAFDTVTISDNNVDADSYQAEGNAAFYFDDYVVGDFFAAVTLTRNNLPSIYCYSSTMQFRDSLTMSNNHVLYSTDGHVYASYSNFAVWGDTLFYNVTGEVVSEQDSLGPSLFGDDSSTLEFFGSLTIENNVFDGQNGSAIYLFERTLLATYGPVYLTRNRGSFAAVYISYGSWLNQGFVPVYTENIVENDGRDNVFCNRGQFSYNFESCDDLKDQGFNCTLNCTSYRAQTSISVTASADSLTAAGTLTFTFTLEAALTSDLRVPFSFAIDDEAWENNYLTRSIEDQDWVTIPAGETTATFSLHAADPALAEDLTYEGVFTLYAARPMGAALFTADQANTFGVTVSFFAATTTPTPSSASSLSSFIGMF